MLSLATGSVLSILQTRLNFVLQLDVIASKEALIQCLDRDENADPILMKWPCIIEIDNTVMRDWVDENKSQDL